MGSMKEGVKEGFLKGVVSEIVEFGVTVLATLGIIKWQQKKEGGEPREKIPQILAGINLNRDDIERTKVMNDFATHGCDKLLAAQIDREWKNPRPYKKNAEGKIIYEEKVGGKKIKVKGEPYEPGSEGIMVNVFTAMRQAFHPNEYEPEEITDEVTKQRVKNHRRVSVARQNALKKEYRERLKEMNELPPHKLDARIEFIHDNKAQQFFEKLVEDVKRAFGKILPSLPTLLALDKAAGEEIHKFRKSQTWLRPRRNR